MILFGPLNHLIIYKSNIYTPRTYTQVIAVPRGKLVIVDKKMSLFVTCNQNKNETICNLDLTHKTVSF